MCVCNVSSHADLDSSSQMRGVNEVTSQTVALSPEDAADIDELLLAYRRSLEIQMDGDVPRDKVRYCTVIALWLDSTALFSD